MNTDDLYEKAKILSAEGKNQEAQDMYTKTIELILGRLSDGDGSTSRPTRNDMLSLAYNNRGHLRYLRVDFDEAVDDYTEAIKINEGLAIAYYNRGQIHYRLARFELGIADFEKCLELQPSFHEAELALKTAKQDKLERDMKTSPGEVVT
ncbi:tetratricopeptide repeat protein 32-like isoform X2 [Anneissia japonica]|uniref:tetratricopeptide repeat protein 32-like isoform X2 n=1 Tax=Anneissia japonica TaxID=1529436 RepID=UPI001425ACD8|nr:tetratricopeptide repeat protein 32-like isoform X2 [Anneissia japonica]